MCTAAYLYLYHGYTSRLRRESFIIFYHLLLHICPKKRMLASQSYPDSDVFIAHCFRIIGHKNRSLLPHTSGFIYGMAAKHCHVGLNRALNMCKFPVRKSISCDIYRYNRNHNRFLV